MFFVYTFVCIFYIIFNAFFTQIFYESNSKLIVRKRLTVLCVYMYMYNISRENNFIYIVYILFFLALKNAE